MTSSFSTSSISLGRVGLAAAPELPTGGLPIGDCARPCITSARAGSAINGANQRGPTAFLPFRGKHAAVKLPKGRLREFLPSSRGATLDLAEDHAAGGSLQHAGDNDADIL